MTLSSDSSMSRSPLVCAEVGQQFLDDGAHLFGLVGGALLEEGHFAADGQISVDAGQDDIRQHENQDEFECQPHVSPSRAIRITLRRETLAHLPRRGVLPRAKRPRDRPQMPLYSLIRRDCSHFRLLRMRLAHAVLYAVGQLCEESIMKSSLNPDHGLGGPAQLPAQLVVPCSSAVALTSQRPAPLLARRQSMRPIDTRFRHREPLFMA